MKGKRILSISRVFNVRRANCPGRTLSGNWLKLISSFGGDSPVIVVDHFTGFDAATQTYDGVHPNADGEIHLSDRWLAALEDVLAR